MQCEKKAVYSGNQMTHTSIDIHRSGYSVLPLPHALWQA